MREQPTPPKRPTQDRPDSVPAMRSGPRGRDNPLTRSTAGMIGLGVLGLILLACFGSAFYTFGTVKDDPVAGTAGSVRYDFQDRLARHIPPTWAWSSLDDERALAADSYQRRIRDWAAREAVVRDARRINSETSQRLTADELIEGGREPSEEQIAQARPVFVLGTDILGRSLLIRCLAGGAISLGIGIAAAMLSVFLGTIYGAVAGYIGGRLDAVMMRIVDVLYGLPYILLVVLLAVAVESVVDQVQFRRSEQAVEQRARFVERELAAMASVKRADPEIRAAVERRAFERFPAELSAGTLRAINLVTLLVAIGGVSWLTMARVVRGQVLSLKSQPFMEAARAMGVPVSGQFVRHLLPNLVGPIVVYATLTVPQAILQESFLSFLGIGVRPPVPSWGNLAADALVELNPYQSNWWLLLFPCLLLAVTLLALNFVGEGLREALDPKRAR